MMVDIVGVEDTVMDSTGRLGCRDITEEGDRPVGEAREGRRGGVGGVGAEGGLGYLLDRG